MVMTWASAGSRTFGVVDAGSAARPAPAAFDWPGNLLPDIAVPACAPAPPRTPRISPRRKSVLRWSIDRPGSLTAPGFSGGFAPGLGRNWMNPTLSPNFGPGGGGGGGGASMTGSGLVSGGGSLMSLGGGVGAFCVGAAGAVGGATGAATAGAASASRIIWISVRAGGGGAAITWSAGGGGAGGGGTRVGGEGGGGGGATHSGCSRMSCSSRYSAVILSSELEATRAAVRFSALALARTCLLSKPSFFEMSYIRTGIINYRFEPRLPLRLHRLDPNIPELPVAPPASTGDRRFADLERAPGCLGARRFQNGGSLSPYLRDPR